MTNEEKAREISNKNNILGRYTMDEIEKSCLGMAQWKDEQLKEILKKKMDFFYPPIDDYNEGKLVVLRDLYQELFDEYYI